MNRRVLLGTFLISVFAAGCTPQQQTNDTQFSKATDQCAGQVVSEHYIVQWKDGHTSRVIAANDEDLVQTVVVPQRNKIKLAEPDYKITLPPRMKAESFASPVYADNWGPQAVHAGTLWSQGDYGAGVVVAVIDTGLDRTHTQLQNQIALNQGEIGTDASGHDKKTNGIDDDHNGYVDDWGGYDFVNQTGQVVDDNGHGTHVSGIIAAQHSDTVPHGGSYVEGIAPQAKILPLKFLDKDGGGVISDAVAAIDYAVARGAKVINASWGGSGCSQTLRDHIQSLESKNIIFVAAAGNDFVDIDYYKEYPASFPSNAQITVGAVTQDGTMASFSNYGDIGVDLFAPGQAITSTFPGGMETLDGTSMATPFVTGAVALLDAAMPGATISEIRQALFSSAIQSSGYRNASEGRLDLSRTLDTLRQIHNASH